MADPTPTPAVIPVAFEDVLKYVNMSDLKGSQRIIDLFGAHEGEILVWLEAYTVESDFTAATAVGGDDDAIRAAAFSAGYCLHSLAVALPFLNINTVGKGLIKTTGIDANATELLNGNEISELQRKFDIQAIEQMKAYLNNEGKALLAGLKPQTKKSFRAVLISGTAASN